MDCKQPKPDSKKYSDLINDIEKGIIKIPKFQREFVWSMDKTAKLLDSILKGYPIGTFILWETAKRINDVKNIGNLDIPDTPEGHLVQYVLDGQQRITSLFAAYRGAQIRKTGEKKTDDYKSIVVNLDKNVSENDDQVITSEPTGEKSISLFDVLNFSFDKARELSGKFTDAELNVINGYSTAFRTYDFSTVVLKKEDIDSAIEVFTRINTGGQTLTLFEIMSAKTYDEERKFDMQEKWKSFSEELAEIKYEGVSSTVILSLLALVISPTKECKRKTILALDKRDIIDTWDDAISALKESIDYFRTIYRIPVSQILPYDSLLVPFSYFFFYQKKEKPNSDQRKYLEEFFWRMSLSNRYSGATESSLAQDIKRIDRILQNQRPGYSGINVRLDSPEALVETSFSAANSYCKAVLCLLAYQEPKSYQDNGKITLENAWLKQANSKNYHYFFPKKYLEKKNIANRSSLMNITLVSDRLRKRAIRARAPSGYIVEFQDENRDIGRSLKSHFIGLHGFGIESDDYGIFLRERAKLIFDELKARIELQRKKPANEEIQELIASGESGTVEFKSTLRYDLYTKSVNKKLEYAVARAIAAFLNSNGGDLFIGIDDDQNALELADDIATLSKGNMDGFRLHLVEVIKKYIGAEHFTHIKTTFPVYDDVEICRVRVEKSGKPVFTEYEGKKDFFIRADCSSQPLDSEEAVAYIEKHW